MSGETPPTKKVTPLLLSPLPQSQADPSPHLVSVDDCRECSECLQKVDAGDRIECDKCTHSLHLACTGLPAYELVKYSKKHQYKRKFACRACIEGMHPTEYHKLEAKVSSSPANSQAKEINELRKTIEVYEDEVQRLTDKVSNLKSRLQKEEEEEENHSLPPSLAPSEYETQIKEWISKVVDLKLRTREEKIGSELERRLTLLEKQVKDKSRMPPPSPPPPPQQSGVDLRHQRPKTFQHHNADQQRRSRPPPTCFSCGRVGHIAKNCYRPTFSQRRPRGNVRPMGQMKWPRPGPLQEDREERFHTIQTVGPDGRIFVTPRHLLTHDREQKLYYPARTPEPNFYPRYPEPSFSPPYNARPYNFDPSNFSRIPSIPPVHF